MLKIGNAVLNGPKEMMVIIPRETGDLVFKFVAVLDDKPFNDMYPMPKMPKVRKPNNVMENNATDPKYQELLKARQDARTAWFFLQSVKPSNIEWQKVKENDPTTWHLFEQELREAGLSAGEYNKVNDVFLECNIVTDAMLTEARNRFLVSQAAALAEQSFQNSEQQSTPPGEPANASESVPQA